MDDENDASPGNVENAFLSPAGLKRKQTKKEDCKFCCEDVRERQLKDHLISNKRCALLYMKINKVTTFDLLLIRLFSCEYCCLTRRIDLKKHLKSHPNCLNHYRGKYQEDEMNNLLKRVNVAKRKTFPSRSASVTAKQNKEKQLKKIEERRFKTMAEAINEFKEKTSFGNYRVCVECRSNFRLYGARPINIDEELYVRLNLSENRSLRRFGTMFICNKCDKEEPKEQQNMEKHTLGLEVIDEVVTFYPQHEGLSEFRGEIPQKRIKVMFPTSLEAIKTNDSMLKRIDCEVAKIYKIEPVHTATVENLYQCEINKYKAELASQLYCGSITEDGNFKVSNVNQITSAAKITGSRDWFADNAKGMKQRQDQLGHIHITLKIDIPQHCNEVLATCLVQQGIPVTTEKRGMENGEFEVLYKVHLDHMSNVDCSEDCVNKIPLNDFVKEDNFDIMDIGNKFIGTYVNSCHEKIVRFIKDILQAPSCGLCCHNYHLFLVFDVYGKGSIIGSIWPDEFKSINEAIARNEGNSGTGDDIVRFVDKNISCTGDREILKSNFGMSETEASNLSELVLHTQLHLCDGEDDCEYCEAVPLPSLETAVKGCCSKTNLESAGKFLEIMRKRLKSLPLEEKKLLKTFVWLNSEFEDVLGDISDNFEQMKVEFMEEDTTIILEVDERLAKYFQKYPDEPYIAAYQYALSCCGPNEGACIIYQRLWIVDCLIKPFNPLFLKANNFSCEVQVVNNTCLFEKFFFPRTEEKGDSGLLFNHRNVSLEEAISLADPLIKRVYSSAKDQFVNSKEKRKSTFKKGWKDDEDVYTLEGFDGNFKLLDSVISRHFDRKTAASDGLLLAETALWYDYMGKDKSEEVSNTYSNLDIPLSETDLISNSGKLPEYILCNNGDVLKKRTSRKILRVPEPHDTREQMYSKCVLFLPIKSENDLVGPKLDMQYNKINTVNVPALQVELNEKKMFPMRMFKLTEINLLDDLLELLNSDTDEEELDLSVIDSSSV